MFLTAGPSIAEICFRNEANRGRSAAGACAIPPDRNEANLLFRAEPKTSSWKGTRRDEGGGQRYKVLKNKLDSLRLFLVVFLWS